MGGFPTKHSHSSSQEQQEQCYKQQQHSTSSRDNPNIAVESTASAPKLLMHQRSMCHGDTFVSSVDPVSPASSACHDAPTMPPPPSSDIYISKEPDTLKVVRKAMSVDHAGFVDMKNQKKKGLPTTHRCSKLTKSKSLPEDRRRTLESDEPRERCQLAVSPLPRDRTERNRHAAVPPPLTRVPTWDRRKTGGGGDTLDLSDTPVLTSVVRVRSWSPAPPLLDTTEEGGVAVSSPSARRGSTGPISTSTQESTTRLWLSRPRASLTVMVAEESSSVSSGNDGGRNTTTREHSVQLLHTSSTTA